MPSPMVMPNLQHWGRAMELGGVRALPPFTREESGLAGDLRGASILLIVRTVVGLRDSQLTVPVIARVEQLLGV
jgi:hypothetical protein